MNLVRLLFLLGKRFQSLKNIYSKKASKELLQTATKQSEETIPLQLFE